MNDIAQRIGATYYSAAYPNYPLRSYNVNPFGKKVGKDFLPMLNASHLFLSARKENTEAHNNPEAGDFLVDFHLMSDTNELEGREPVPAEAAESLLLIYLYRATETLPKGTNWYHQVWLNTDYPAADGVWFPATSFQSVRVSRLTVDLAEFADPAGASAVAGRILDHLKTN
ncbi:hypothetical protein [Paraburkholderia fynbosensis]|uniref:hypothetical protein n=1 Tax=Paraburkholderia fynbosensis TaxID=1200993 RepID=UPI001581BBBC|nr:hypothetical protein [Paraburkholderia fynbosensis]